ncbi:MAG: tRNA (N6-threonylcarbamoyladenosine(37)-N6)-methyltransferase TrmO, partial [Deltaproteobacteria bacterium]|nr:tRNA (N6-threonylcarbamoyladenosine(37)-N6)-methyltransferase TrmO [Deltaproteobacteria bacterium]MBW2320435.1 tRNA (N6-threonylcarbamoyladenosine(37)-N6)-methyltransferase TrmO [Deltaproteobacteria bacterium]
MVIKFTPIGTVYTAARKLPRHWSVSHVEGTLEILPEYTEGLSDIRAGQR